MIAKVRHIFMGRYGQELSEDMLRAARQEYKALIPQLPHIGGRQPFTIPMGIAASRKVGNAHRLLRARAGMIEN